MKKRFKQFLRALYQIIVVGVLCMPYRLVALLITLYGALMVPGTGVRVKDYMSNFTQQIEFAYAARRDWVKNGDAPKINWLEVFNNLTDEETK